MLKEQLYKFIAEALGSMVNQPEYFDYNTMDAVIHKMAVVLRKDNAGLQFEKFYEDCGLWTEKRYEEFTKGARKDMIADLIADFGKDFSCDIPNEIAKSVLTFERGLKTFIIHKLGAEDYVGRLTDDIAG